MGCVRVWEGRQYRDREGGGGREGRREGRLREEPDEAASSTMVGAGRRR